jgi:hypothetical protein
MKYSVVIPVFNSEMICSQFLKIADVYKFRLVCLNRLNIDAKVAIFPYR